MNISRRIAVGAFVIVTILLGGIIFWPWIFLEIIQPTALVVWLLLRMFVLSIAQSYYWGAIILMILIFLYRFLPHDQTTIPPVEFDPSNGTLDKIDYWRLLFTLADNDIREEKTLKRELTYLLVSLYASEQHTTSDFTIYDALQNGQIPLPEHIHTFLFAKEPGESGGAVKKFFRSMRKTPQKWIRQWTGQEKAERYQMINQVLSFMETSLEIKHDA